MKSSSLIPILAIHLLLVHHLQNLWYASSQELSLLDHALFLQNCRNLSCVPPVSIVSKVGVYGNRSRCLCCTATATRHSISHQRFHRKQVKIWLLGVSLSSKIHHWGILRGPPSLLLHADTFLAPSHKYQITERHSLLLHANLASGYMHA